MVKHTQTIHWQFADELFECVWPFCEIGAQRVKERQKPWKTCKWVIFKNIAAKTKKWFLRNSLENLYWEIIFFTVIFSRFCKKFRSSHQRHSIKKDVLKNFVIFTGKHSCWNLLLIKSQDWGPKTLLKRDPNTGVLSCEYCKNFKKTYFEKHLWMTASVNSRSAIFQESLVLPFKLNALASRISWQHMHSVLIVALFLRTQSIMLCFRIQKQSPRYVL